MAVERARGIDLKDKYNLTTSQLVEHLATKALAQYMQAERLSIIPFYETEAALAKNIAKGWLKIPWDNKKLSAIEIWQTQKGSPVVQKQDTTHSILIKHLVNMWYLVTTL